MWKFIRNSNGIAHFAMMNRLCLPLHSMGSQSVCRNLPTTLILNHSNFPKCVFVCFYYAFCFWKTLQNNGRKLLIFTCYTLAFFCFIFNVIFPCRFFLLFVLHQLNRLSRWVLLFVAVPWCLMKLSYSVEMLIGSNFCGRHIWFGLIHFIDYVKNSDFIHPLKFSSFKLDIIDFVWR